jgi:hypothetical protein
MIKPRILFYDLESAPLKAWVWSTGKQYVNHKQLVSNHDRYGIICITYCWNDDKPAQCIDWGYEEQDTAKVVREFDKIISQADFCIGKNSDRFDTKMINAARMFAGLPGNPEWTKYKDDLEVQMRRYFRMPSQSLDYISHQLGLGGKIKMEFQDWIDIVEKNKNGEKALAKMIKYGKKDVVDTRTLWFKLSEHFDSKWNQAVYQGNNLACKHMDCGSTNLANRGSPRISGKTLYQEWRCLDCHRYAGRTILDSKGKIS